MLTTCIAGGFVRRGVYAGLAMTAAAAVCYPHQVADMSDAAYNRAKTEVVQLWDSQKTKSMPSEPLNRNANRIRSNPLVVHNVIQTTCEDRISVATVFCFLNDFTTIFSSNFTAISTLDSQELNRYNFITRSARFSQ